ETRHDKLLPVEWCSPDQQFVEKNSEAVDVAARIHVQSAHLGLFRTDVSRCANELLELRINRLICELAGGGFGDPEINYLGDRHAIVECDEDVRGLDVAVNDSLLVRMLD